MKASAQIRRCSDVDIKAAMQLTLKSCFVKKNSGVPIRVGRRVPFAVALASNRLLSRPNSVMLKNHAGDTITFCGSEWKLMTDTIANSAPVQKRVGYTICNRVISGKSNNFKTVSATL